MLELITGQTTAETAAAVVGATLDELAREGARRMLVAALEAEVADYVARFGESAMRRATPRWCGTATARPRKVRRGSGRSRCGAAGGRPAGGRRREAEVPERILPPYVRRSPKVAEVLPLLYLHGLSTGDFREALPALLGEDAAGLSPTPIARLMKVWEAEYAAFRRRDLADRDYVYVWADGVHFNIRLEDDRLCTLVVIGARPDGTKEVIAVEDGYRESTESWLTLLRDLKRRGHARPGPGGRRRRARLLGGRAGRLAGDAPRALLGAPDRQRARQAAEAAPAEGQAGAARHDVRREPGRLPGRDRRVRGRVRRQVPQGGRRRSRPTRSAC